MTEKQKNLIYLITYLAYASIYIARVNLSMAGPDLKTAQVLTTSQLGLLGTAFSVFYAIGRLLNSLRSDTTEPKTMIGTGLLLTSLSNIGVGFLPPFPGMLLLWCLNAFAQSMLWSSVLRIVCALYAEGKPRSGRLSFIVSTVAAGQVAGILLSSALLSHAGLCWAFYLPGLITFFLSAAVFLLFPQLEKKAPQSVSPEVPDPLQKKENPLLKIREALSYDSVRLALLPDVFMGLMKDNVTLWMAVYFADVYGIDLSGITGYVLLIPLIGLAARLSFPFALKLCKGNEHQVSEISFAGCLLSSLMLLLAESALPAVIGLGLVYAFMSLVNSSMLSIFPARFASKGRMGSVSGLMDLAAYLGAGAGSLLFGFTIEKLGYGSMFAVWTVLSAAGWLVMRKLCRLSS